MHKFSFLLCATEINLFCFFFTSCQLQHIASYQLQHTPKDQFGFTDQNLNFPAQLFVSILRSKLSWRRQLGMTPSFMSLSCLAHFSVFLQRSLFSSPPDDAAGSLMFFCSSQASRAEGRGVDDGCIFDRIYAFPGRRPRATHIYIYTHMRCTLRRNLMQLPPGRARPVYEY